MENKNTVIKVVSSIMGSHKTTNIFKQINNDAENKYIYVTPYLDEIQRCKDVCSDKKFYEPKQMGKGKLDSLHKLLLQERNIATTHALFKLATTETYEILQASNYVLVLDEVMNVVEKLIIKKDDRKMLMERYFDVQEDGTIKWREDEKDYDGTLVKKYKTMVDNNSLIMYGDKILMWNFPTKIFECFKESYVLTYLFEAQIQKYYFDMFDIDYEYYYSDENGYHLRGDDFSEKEKKEQLKKLINIYEGKYNKIGDGYYTLSKSWYVKNKNKNETLILKFQKNVFNYFRSLKDSKANDNMWTTFKDFKSSLTGKKYARGFVTLNARATNVYSHKKSLAYCVNIFVTPILYKFFETRDIKLDQDTYALSEFLQWIWRSRIRNNEPIDIYCASERMRRLLISWLNDEKECYFDDIK